MTEDMSKFTTKVGLAEELELTKLWDMDRAECKTEAIQICKQTKEKSIPYFVCGERDFSSFIEDFITHYLLYNRATFLSLPLVYNTNSES